MFPLGPFCSAAYSDCSAPHRVTKAVVQVLAGLQFKFYGFFGDGLNGYGIITSCICAHRQHTCCGLRRSRIASELHSSCFSFDLLPKRTRRNQDACQVLALVRNTPKLIRIIMNRLCQIRQHGTKPARPHLGSTGRSFVAIQRLCVDCFGNHWNIDPPQILRGAKKFKLELFFCLAPSNVCKIQTLSRRAIIPRGFRGFVGPQGFTLRHPEGARVRHVHLPPLEFSIFFAIFPEFRNFRPPSGNHFFDPGG